MHVPWFIPRLKFPLHTCKVQPRAVPMVTALWNASNIWIAIFVPEGALVKILRDCRFVGFASFFCSGKLKPQPEEERAEGASRNNTSPAVAVAHWPRALVKLRQIYQCQPSKWSIGNYLSVREFMALHYTYITYNRSFTITNVIIYHSRIVCWKNSQIKVRTAL